MMLHYGRLVSSILLSCTLLKTAHCFTGGIRNDVAGMIPSTTALSFSSRSMSPILVHNTRSIYCPKPAAPTAAPTAVKPTVKPTATATTTTTLHSALNPVVFKAAFSATSKLLSSIGIGALTSPAGPKQFGRILDANAVSALSKLTYWLFQPCFLLCGVASTLAKATEGNAGMPTSALLLLPLASLIQISLGALSAKLITTKKFGMRPRFLGIEENDEAGASDIKMCTTFANSGPLPLILSDALFGGAILSDVSACISFYLLVWSPLFWTLGGNILGLNDKDDSSSNGLEADGNLISSVVKQFKTFLSPPVMGSIMGVIIGSNAFLRNLLLKPNSLLAPLFGSLRTFGSAYLPAAILVLAGSLVKKRTNTNDAVTAVRIADTTATNEKDKSSLSAKTIVSILISRFIVSPILALTSVRLMTYANLMPVNNPRILAITTFTLLMEGK